MGQNKDVLVLQENEADIEAKAFSNNKLSGEMEKKLMAELFKNVLRIKKLEVDIPPRFKCII